MKRAIVGMETSEQAKAVNMVIGGAPTRTFVAADDEAAPAPRTNATN